MPFNVLLLPLLGGFIFVRYWNRTKYHAIRAEKERILLLASAAGLIALALSFAIKALLGALFPCSDYPNLPCFPVVWYRLIPFPYSAVSVLALILGATMWIPLNRGIVTWIRDLAKPDIWTATGSWFMRVFTRGWENPEEIDRVLKEDGDPLDLLLRRAEKESKTILATLTTGKVYVGFVSSTNPPSSQTRSVSIVPTKSGYRDSVMQKVHYEVYYSDALARLNEDIDHLLTDLKVAHRQRRELIRKRKSKRVELDKLTEEPDDGPPKPNAEQPAAAASQLNLEIQLLDQQIHSVEHERNDLVKRIEGLEEIINDFRLVFPVDQISTISIYREEVNIKYFCPRSSNPHDDSPSEI
jgi:hypothetical protein